MSLLSIPLDIFLIFILPNLDVPEILTLSSACRTTRDFYNDNTIWKNLYIRRKKSDFSKKERSIIKKKLSLSWSNWLLTTDDLYLHNKLDNKVTLFIKNNSDVPFRIFHVQRMGSYIRSEEKYFGKVLPHGTKIIESFLYHRWLFFPKTDNRTNEVYQSKGVLLKEKDIYHPSIPLTQGLVDQRNGVPVVNNVIDINVGEVYDTETAKEIVDKPLPKNPRNFVNFKGMVLRYYLPDVEKKVTYSKDIIHNCEAKLKNMKERIEELKGEIKITEMGLCEEKNKLIRMNNFVNVIKGE